MSSGSNGPCLCGDPACPRCFPSTHMLGEAVDGPDTPPSDDDEDELPEQRDALDNGVVVVFPNWEVLAHMLDLDLLRHRPSEQRAQIEHMLHIHGARIDRYRTRRP